MEDLFMDRNHAVMLAVRFAQMLGLPAGVGDDPLDLGWTVLYVDLPNGEQVSWRMPSEDVLGKDWPDYPFMWDDHNLAEKRQRLVEFLSDYFISLPSPTSMSAKQVSSGKHENPLLPAKTTSKDGLKNRLRQLIPLLTLRR